MNELALFAGAGGGILGGHLLGWRTVCAVEWEAYPASVLVARQNDKILPTFPIWDDVQTFDGKPWRGIVDVVSGGFPCQDISAAGGGLESQEQEVQCGDIWHGLLARLDQDTLLWKIPQCSLLEDLEQSLEIWPRWGTMQNGVCYQQPMLVQNTLENEYGLWATPNCMDTLPPLISKSFQESQTGRRQISSNLRDQVFQKFPTPNTEDWKNRGNMSNASIQRRVKIGKQVSLSMVVHPTSGQLNPTWTEWLMGWPLEWTDLKPLEMDKCHCVQQLHGTSLKEE